MDGGIAVTKVTKLRKLLGHICQNGYEHHVGMARGHCAKIIHEAISKYMKWDIYHHNEKTDGESF
jgi:hypothetical protein